MARQFLMLLGLPEITRFLGSPRGFAVTLVLVVLGYLMSTVSLDAVVAGLIAYTDALRRGLEATNVAHFADLFYERLTGCTLLWSDRAHWWRTVCEPGRRIEFGSHALLYPVTFGRLFYETSLEMLQTSNLFGRILFVAALLPTGIWLWMRMMPRPLFEEFFLTVIAFCVWCALTPIAASVVALVLLGLLWLCAMVFSLALGGVVFTATLAFHGYETAKAALELPGLGGAHSASVDGGAPPG
ncbi:hypothetical protein [Propylenella binzhouense]|uniref:Uncharacterized protein n=1 Tax=Propylenella binzhouense TaxID=2555902 RepID=A0A964T5N6_9HYPH|nr:hypothetical protein [Propylenella binzhouense]MYZ48864.1 hypothetical protein [Propylenella binzhouense]